MRIHYPIDETPLFVYPAISIQKYDWGRKKTSQKVFSYVVMAFLLIIFCYGLFVTKTHHLFTWKDVSWTLVWQIIKFVGTLALFPIVVFSVLFSFKGKHPYQPEHKFFKEWAKVYTGYGKGSHSFFFVEEVDRFEVRKSVIEDQPFYLVTVRFKRSKFPLFGTREIERFGIRAKEQADLQPWRDWAQANQIEIAWDTVE